MSSSLELRHYKAPRWISTPAGQWAYEVNAEWRKQADGTFAVSERRLLLEEAEKMQKVATAAQQD
ncbi:MAG: hypothetical protein EOM24_36075 [Chloroflexia bacterium]|jgi:hypothetical protein|nr:hypothetical protein [Chloroflexia bacterium]